MSYEMVFNINDWNNSEILFNKYAEMIGYPNIKASDMDVYQGLVDFINIRTGKTIFQGWDKVYIVFDYKNTQIRFYTDKKSPKILAEYDEKVTKLIKEDKSVSIKERFKDLPKYKPYDKLHRPQLGDSVILGDNTYMITAVETMVGTNLLNITLGSMTIRSDMMLDNCRYVNAEMCGWLDDEEGKK